MHTSHNDFVLWILHTYCRYHSFKMYHTAFWSSLVVQWLGLSTSTVTAQAQFLVRKLRSHKLCDQKEKGIILPFMFSYSLLFMNLVS